MEHHRLGRVSPIGTVKTLGALVMAAAIGRILPAALDIAPILVAWAALGLCALMIGAAIFHLRRNEPQAIVVRERFGPHSFSQNSAGQSPQGIRPWDELDKEL